MGLNRENVKRSIFCLAYIIAGVVGVFCGAEGGMRGLYPIANGLMCVLFMHLGRTIQLMK